MESIRKQFPALYVPLGPLENWWKVGRPVKDPTEKKQFGLTKCNSKFDDRVRIESQRIMYRE